MLHIASHFANGSLIEEAKPDFHVLNYLRVRHLTGPEDAQNTFTPMRLSPPNTLSIAEGMRVLGYMCHSPG